MAEPGTERQVTRQRPKRGEVWLTRLDPTVGNEIRKTRPCLVVSDDGMNASLGTIIVVPLTSGGRSVPFRVATEFRGIEGFLLGDQIRSVSIKRFAYRLGDIDAQTLRAALAVLREMFEE